MRGGEMGGNRGEGVGVVWREWGGGGSNGEGVFS